MIGRRVEGQGQVDLNGASIRSANLREAFLSSANLRGANLSRVDLSGANLINAFLRRADLIGANLSDARLDGQTQLDQACGTDIKGLPPGLALDKPCPPPQ